jgi:hypothetical protein
MNKTNRLITIAIFLAAIVLGWYHLRQALRAIFVFKNDEPLASWVCIISGPLSTLPAIASIFNKKVGGYWLISGGAISALSFISATRWLESSFFLLIVVAPMVLLGLAFLGLEQQRIINNGIANGFMTNLVVSHRDRTFGLASLIFAIVGLLWIVICFSAPEAKWWNSVWFFLLIFAFSVLFGGIGRRSIAGIIGFIVGGLVLLVVSFLLYVG